MKWAVLTLLLAPAILAIAAVDNSVEIEKTPMSATRRIYDPHHPDALMPATEPMEAGVTVSDFRCVVELHGEVLHITRKGTDVFAEVRVKTAHVKLGLDVAEWISRPGAEKIFRHEDGHRMIASHFYANSGDIAAAIVKQFIDTSVFGIGVDSDDAAKNALNIASARIVRDYMIEVRDKSARVQQLYDEITSHGQNDRDEMTAIEMALQASTRPSSRPW